MYARKIKDKTLTFAVSGKLWNDSLVMIDQETKSLWSHILGEAKQGPLTGERLTVVPSVMTDWESWRERHPETTLVMMDRSASAYTKEFHQRRDWFVLGVSNHEDSKAWSFQLFEKGRVFNDSFSGEPVLFVFDENGLTARLFARNVNQQALEFSIQDGKLVDHQTKSTWDHLTGTSTSGPMKGTRLKPLPAIMSFANTWMLFHPESPVLGAAVGRQ